MSTTRLFDEITLGPLTLRNRAWVSPMCQYAVDECDGVPRRWHQVHYGGLALGGWGLVFTEATAVSPEGRISPYDTGLWNDEQARAWREVTDFAHQFGQAMGVQLAHAGRKASTNRLWPGWEPGNVAEADGGWTPLGPTSALAVGRGQTSPVDALDEAGIAAVVDDFAAAAGRCEAAGFDVVEIHAAHGYLLHQFGSPLSNTRTDAWGGSFENRVRLTLDVVRAVREVWHGALVVRLSATDWADGGWTGDDTVRLAGLLRGEGVHLLDVSSGGNVPAPIPVGPGYQVRFAEQVRREAGVPSSAVGLICDPQQAETIVASGQADAVLLARQALREPGWPLRAAHELGDERAAWPPARDRGRWR